MVKKMRILFEVLKSSSTMILIFFICITSSCKDKSTRETYPGNDKKNVKHIHNHEYPLEGEIALQLDKRREIDPAKILSSPGVFNNFCKDTDGTVYILDYKNFKIYKFDNQGKIVSSFLRKGEGPSEVLSYPKIELSESSIWVISEKKIIQFGKNGNFLKEYKLKKYYNYLRMIDSKKFIAFRIDDLSTNRAKPRLVKTLSVYNLNNEELLKNIFKSEKNGRLYLVIGNRRMAVIPDPGIIPDIIYDIDVKRQRINIADNSQYKIYVKDFHGDLKMTFSKPAINSIFSKVEKFKVAEELTADPNIIKSITEALPENLCIIEKIILFQSGYLGVYRINGYNNLELDIFDKEGRFIYIIKLPKYIHHHKLKFYGNVLALLTEKEDTVLYQEYDIKNLENIFKHD